MFSLKFRDTLFNPEKMKRPNFYIPVRIGSFNIQKLQGESKKVTKVISQFDICGLQEVPGLKRLENITPEGFSVLFDNAYPTYGNGLIYRSDIFIVKSFKTHILKDSPCKKTAFEVELKFKKFEVSENEVTLFIVHLDHKDENVRLGQLLKLEKVLPKLSPHIILGDFNSLTLEDYSTEKLAEIAKSRKDTFWESPKNTVTTKINKMGYVDVLGEIPGGMFPTCRFDTRIDYIYLYDLEKDFGFDIDYINADISGASDHKPVGVILLVPV